MDMVHRLTVNLTDKSMAALNDIMSVDGLSKTDAINRALQVYGFLGSELISGKQLLLRDADGSVEGLRII
jgi:hypothetical protein